ncbi:MAG TPA: glycine cleavage system protein GcvH [Clostridia bacterium]|jgi:glycine cleavage system H protein|nr:glycine cleavage system protein GcvH [Clostridia bacterium]
MVPTDRKYTKDHEWVLISGNTAKIGITDHAQNAMGDIVFVDVPAVGDSFSAGESFAVVESVKAASEIYTQVSGKVVEVNEALDGEPELINKDPYGAFLAVIEFSSANEDALLTAQQYEALLAAEA